VIKQTHPGNKKLHSGVSQYGIPFAMQP